MTPAVLYLAPTTRRLAKPTVTARTSKPNPDDLPKDPKDFTGFLNQVRRNFRMAADAEQEQRRLGLDDLRFYASEQWDEKDRAERRAASRPCLTVNRLPQFAKQIINEQRQQRPSIQINPVGDGADVDTAEVIQGLVRHIELNSGADVAYDTAFEHAVISGFGYFRLLTDYVDNKSFDQEILIKRIADPFTVYMDPTCTEPDYSDARWAFIVEDVPRDLFKQRYPDSQVAGLPEFHTVGDSERDWFENSKVRLAEYFWVTTENRTLVQLIDGRVVFEEQMPEDAQIAQRNGEPLTRDVENRVVHRCILNAREVLEEQVWPGKYIPIIPVLGEELIVDGKRKLIGIVRNAKDAQRMYNWAYSGVIEQLALSSRAPWLVAEGQIDDYKEIWQQANVRNFVALPYKPRMNGSDPVPPPIRNAYEPPIQGYIAAIMQSENDLKSTTGIYDASLGQQGAEQSGKAILARQKQGETANYNLVDNLTRAIRHVGRVIVDLIPQIYDVPRAIRIINPDGTHKITEINTVVKENGKLKLYDLTVGRYDVTVSVGPSHQSRRQEFVESVLALVGSAPAVAPFIMDLVVRHMDWPGAAEIADRLKKMLPPQLQDKEGDDQQNLQQVSQENQAKVGMLMQQNAALVQQLQVATSAIEIKRLEVESKERIAALQGQVQLIAAELKAKSSDAQALAKLEFSSIQHRMDLLHQGNTLEQEASQHAAELDHQKQQQAAQLDQQAQLAQQAQNSNAPGGSSAQANQ